VIEYFKNMELHAGKKIEEDFIFMPSTHSLGSKIRGNPKASPEIKNQGANKNVNQLD